MKDIRHYDFKRIDSVMSRIQDDPTKTNLELLKKELNRFFDDSVCEEVIFTRNTDKLFFGMAVYGSIPYEDYEKIICGSEPYRITKYRVEIDSKLMDQMLTDKELTAIVLHEIGHLVNDSNPVEGVRKAIDLYMAKQRENLRSKEGVENRQVLMFAIHDTIRKFTSMFTKNNEEIGADEFVFMCGYGEYLESGFRKITSNVILINKNANVGKLIQLEWALRVYKSMGISRLSAIKTLNRAKSFTASTLERREIDKAIRQINKPDDLIVQETSRFLEAHSNNDSLLSRIQRKGLRSLEEDLYQYEIRIKNVEDEDEALLILRQINSRMSILDDYIDNLDIEDGARERWLKLYDKYDKIREQLTKKSIYNKKMNSLFMNYAYLEDPNR